MYFSVHTAAARLAEHPEHAVAHALLYQSSDAPLAAPEAEAELEDLIDRIQPGWREHVVVRRFLPNMTVTHGNPVADRGGLAGRPSVRIPGFPGIFAAGDWVGDDGMLADASVASARAAATATLECNPRAHAQAA